MQPQSLQQALTQTLETYQRMGLRRFSRQNIPELPEQWLKTISAVVSAETNQEPQQHQTTPPTATAGTTSPPVTRSQTIQPTSADSKVVEHAASLFTIDPRTSAAEPETRSSERLISSTEGTALTAWQQPAFSETQRQNLFADLDTQIRNCRLCSELCGFRHQTVFGVGPLKPTLCFMGEAPGADEDKIGEPFVGRAGQLLTRIIGAMQLKREDVYILNALKCRPPGNRTPMPTEIGNCHPFVEKQLETLQPQFIVCLGAVAVRSLLGWETPIGRLRGKFYRYRGAQVVITYHPSYLLRNEQAKRLVWEDMQMLMKEMGIALPEKA
jgi:DNA polymerase